MHCVNVCQAGDGLRHDTRVQMFAINVQRRRRPSNSIRRTLAWATAAATVGMTTAKVYCVYVCHCQ